jgi:hypothetical protein
MVCLCVLTAPTLNCVYTLYFVLLQEGVVLKEQAAFASVWGSAANRSVLDSSKSRKAV